MLSGCCCCFTDEIIKSTIERNMEPFGVRGCEMHAPAACTKIWALRVIDCCLIVVQKGRERRRFTFHRWLDEQIILLFPMSLLLLWPSLDAIVLLSVDRFPRFFVRATLLAVFDDVADCVQRRPRFFS